MKMVSWKEHITKIGGKLNGLAIKYDSTGNKIAEYQVKNGLKNGLAKIYYDNGNLYSVRFYEDNIMYGTVYYFNQNGDSLKTNASINGKEDFPTKKWLNNGQVFYATYTDTTHNKVQYLWTDSLGKEIKKIQLVWGQKSEYISEDSWIMPN
jgi:antitoxin component YwqK of YwqJK toxin-antitoxin module